MIYYGIQNGDKDMVLTSGYRWCPKTDAEELPLMTFTSLENAKAFCDHAQKVGEGFCEGLCEPFVIGGTI